MIAELMRWEALTTPHARMIECVQIMLQTHDRIDAHKINFSLFSSDNHSTLDCRYDVKHQGIQRVELGFYFLTTIYKYLVNNLLTCRISDRSVMWEGTYARVLFRKDIDYGSGQD